MAAAGTRVELPFNGATCPAVTPYYFLAPNPTPPLSLTTANHHAKQTALAAALLRLCSIVPRKMAAKKSGEFAVVPVAAHPQDSHCASEPEPVVAEGLIPSKDRADRDARARLTVADTDGAGVFTCERGVSSREALLGKNGPAGLAVSDLFFKRETGAPLVDMARAGGLTVGGTNADDVFARERGVSESDLLARETGEPLLLLLDKHRDAGTGVFARERGMSFGEALLGKNLPAGLREIDAPLLDKKDFFGDDEDYYFAFQNGAPPITGLVAADEHGVRTDKGARVVTTITATAGEAPRAAPSAPHSEQVD